MQLNMKQCLIENYTNRIRKNLVNEIIFHKSNQYHLSFLKHPNDN